jgi:hypothetical protein
MKASTRVIFRGIAAVCCLLLLLPSQASAQLLDLDPLVNWDDPLSLQRSDLERLFRPVVEATGRRPWQERTNDSTAIGWGYDAVNNKTLFKGRLKVALSNVHWETKAISFEINEEDMSPADEQWLYDKLDEVLKVERRPTRAPTSGAVLHYWYPGNCEVATYKSSGRRFTITIRTSSRRRDESGVVTTRKAPDLSANLDALLNFATFWQWTPSDFEKHYVVKVEDQAKQQKPPQFEWVNASRDRARFSRRMFSNAETKLTMFGGSIKVEEAIVEFVNGKAARATISFYNRGDSGDIEVAEFDRIFKTIGQNLGQVTKVGPKKQLMSANAALPVTGWMWSSPAGVALLEYNDYKTPGKVTKPEFLRLKLAAPNQADWSMGKMATGVQRMELQKRVTKTPEGDVYISGVPMVDQGQKGYCVAASCQRLFEYMRIPCDQHEMAKLVSVDAESGANIMTMQKSLAKIDSAFKVTFKPLVNPEQYYSANRKRRVSEKEFLSLIKENVEKGVPLLWGLILGEKPEDPPLPGAGQTRGGHMRMIIGYNLAKNQVLFTDSWGAGHELKRMAMLDAYDVTMGLYSMAPRGF